MASEDNIISTIYNNLYTYFDYRNLIPLEKKVDNDAFIKHIYNNEYFLIHTLCNNSFESEFTDSDLTEVKNNLSNTSYKNIKNYKITYVILFHYNTDIHTKSPEFKKILNILSKTPFLYNIIIITKNTLSTHVKNYISTINNKKFEFPDNSGKKCQCQYNYCSCIKLQIFAYVYDRFTFIIPNHILCNKHRILSYKEEVKLLETELMTKSMFPSISINDPCIIWSSGIVGNIVECTRNDDITGLSLYYRVIK